MYICIRIFGGEGVQEEVNSEGVGGCLQRFFPEGLSSELFINNSFSVKQAISYFTVSLVLCIDHLLSTVR